MNARAPCVLVDLPALAGEFLVLSDVAVPMTSERLAVARVAVASAVKRLSGISRVFSAIEQGLELAEPGSDYDFAVRDLLGAQRDLFSAASQVTAAAQLLMRTNIALTAAATIAACDDDTEIV